MLWNMGIKMLGSILYLPGVEYVPKVLVAVGLIVLGIVMIQGKKEALDQETLDQETLDQEALNQKEADSQEALSEGGVDHAATAGNQTGTGNRTGMDTPDETDAPDRNDHVRTDAGWVWSWILTAYYKSGNHIFHSLAVLAMYFDFTWD